ncbi:hypothetical protein HCN44_000719 [Aphidius gifuensis]|uniref:W2 domain-containing protein n=1 Tax=Aphidius gifuensis TaxID=684658 RepID=A0A835CNK4_APHGI|nr:hypothetical protein HCN44_000719 [Aphidius gifuensis]
MKKLKYESLWESHKHDKTFSDAIEVSLYRLQKKKLLIDSTEDEISDQSTRLGVKIFKAIMNVRKSFLMKEKLKELNVKLKGSKKEEEEISEDDIQNESMCIDHQQVSETLHKHQKSSVSEISESESDVTEMNNDQTLNNSTYSLGYDEEIEEYSTIDENQMLLSNDNNKLKNTSSAVNLSAQNIQQVAAGGVKRKLMDNDSNLPTTQNKRLCVVETSTLMETNQPRPRCAPKNDESKEKTLDRSLHNEQNAWKPTARLQINNITADYKTQELYKKIRCILNKLTAENMDKLTQQVRDLNIDCHEKLKGFVDLIFDKAVDEPYFAAIYSMMCKKLADMQIESSWEPTTRFQTCRITDDSETQTLAKVHCILIELTPENVDKLAQQIKDLNINTHERLEGVVDLIFDKAIDEPNFASVYALMCKKLSEMNTNVVDIRQGNKIDFKTLLVTRCKHAYENNSMIMNQSNRNVSHQYHTKNAEKATPRLPKCNITDDSSTQTFYKKVRDILNKLTQANIDESTQRIKSLVNTMSQVSKERRPSKKDDKNIEGVLKTKATSNEPTELPTEVNKQPYAVATSTSMEANQQTSIALPGSSCTNAPINDRLDDKRSDVYNDLPQSPELETTATNLLSTSRLHFLYSQLDEQIKTLINIAIYQFDDKFDHLDYSEFIRRSLEVTMLESLNIREKYWSFIAKLITDNVFPLELFQSEYDKMFEEINDVSPIFWTYKAEILKILVKRGAHPIKELKRTTSVLKKKGLVGNLVGELLKILLASEGQTSITDKWNNSGIEWTDLFDTSLEDPDDIIKKYNLQFLTLGKTDPLNEQLLKLLRESDIANTIKWITATVGEEKSRTPKFVRILFTLLLESGIETKYSFDKRNFYQPNRLKIINLLPLMKDYIDDNLESELQCLYALTDVNHRCRNPPGFVYDIIKELHQKGIISLSAFSVWHNGTATTSELIGHDEAKWNLLCQSFWIKFQNRDD